jgi:GAF domain-containing protein
MAMDTERLALTFVELGDTLVADYDVVDVLRTLAERCVELFDATAAGIALVPQGADPRLVVASSDRAPLLALLEIHDEDGPALECYRSGEPVAVSRLADRSTDWPRFTAAAGAQGFGTVTALPLRRRREVIGVLSLLGTEHHPPVHGRDAVIAQALADAATIAILQYRDARTREVVNEQLENALTSRVVIEQAKGRLSAVLDIDVDEAFQRLRKRARDNRRLLTDVAREALDGDCHEFADTDSPAR